jgi:7-cyano-7-deazaguanine synthase in queuosine biosynthesis
MVKSPAALPLPLPVRVAFRGLAGNLCWTDDSKDLIEVATAVLLADRLVTRPRSGRRSRRIRIRLRVRNVKKWKSAIPRLHDVLGILTDDDFSFDLAFGASSKINFACSVPPSRSKSVSQVALFSGGLDSAAAAALFAQEGLETAYVTHYVRDMHRISRLLQRIYDRYDGKAEVPHALFYMRPAGAIVSHLRENSRRTRSFLFVSLAVVTAVGLGIGDVRVCENGPLALNLALTSAMVPTKHAHSQFLQSMEELVRHVFERQIRISNPFELLTKGKMSEVFTSNPGIALATVSCWNQQWSGSGANYGHGHCGFCVPCLVRRVSLEAAGISIPRRHFDIDVESLAGRRDLSRENLRRLTAYRALLSFASTVEACRGWQDFVRAFPAVIDSQPTSHPMSSNVWFQSVFRMTRTFVREIIETLAKD